MSIFDAPGREHCVVERQVTNTPLQVLALWNDEGLVEAARAFAERCLAASDDDVVRVHFAFRTVLQREPTTAETATCLRLLDRHPTLTTATEQLTAWTVLTNLLLSLDEALHRN